MMGDVVHGRCAVVVSGNQIHDSRSDRSSWQISHEQLIVFTIIKTVALFMELHRLNMVRVRRRCRSALERE